MSKVSYFMSAIPTLCCFDFRGEKWEVERERERQTQRQG